MQFSAIGNFLRGFNGYIRLRRQTGKGLYIEVRCAAYVTKWRPELRYQIEQAGGIVQGDRDLIISNEEIARKQWPAPPRHGDVVYVEDEDATYIVLGSDPSGFDGQVTRYDMTMRGT